MRYTEFTIEGRNAVIEAFRSGKTIDKLYVLDGCKDGPVMTIIREAKKTDTIIRYVDREILDRLSKTGHHQGVVALSLIHISEQCGSIRLCGSGRHSECRKRKR